MRLKRISYRQYFSNQRTIWLNSAGLVSNPNFRYVDYDGSTPCKSEEAFRKISLDLFDQDSIGYIEPTSDHGPGHANLNQNNPSNAT